jgi:hypothetical protein
MYDPSDKPSPSSRWANNTSTGQSTPTGRWTHDRYDPSEQAERSGNDKKSTWRIDISSTSSGDSTPTKWSQAGLHAENLPKNDGSDSPKQSNAPGNSELTLEQPANDSGRSTPQTNDAPAEHEAAGSQWSKYKTDSSASFNSPSREKEAPPKQETPGSQWNNDTSASFNNENRENDAPAKQETAGSQWNSYRNDSSTSFNNRSRESDSPAKQDTAGSQWNTYNTDSSTSFNNRDQSRGNTTRNHNNDKRGFNNADDKAFEQLKNEIYGTSTSTSTSASRTDDRNNQVKKHWEKDENDQWAPIGARDEATSDDTNSKWAKGNEGDCPPEITDKDAYMVKISNPEEGTHYWVKAYKPCLAMNSNWGDVFSTSSPAAQSPTVSSPAAPSPPPDPAASKWAQWAQKSS